MQNLILGREMPAHFDFDDPDVIRATGAVSITTTKKLAADSSRG
jgi:hypothetical protein